MFDNDGVLEHINGKGYIDMSTVNADTSSKISEVGILAILLSSLCSKDFFFVFSCFFVMG